MERPEKWVWGRWVCVGALAFSLAGCATHEQRGAVGGGAMGATAGHVLTGGSPLGTVVGAMIGTAWGADFGRRMDEQDRQRAAYALQNQQVGQPYSWQSNTGAQYTATPTREFSGAEGPCREFTLDATIDGRPDRVTGTACRGSDGVWRTQ